MQKEESLKCDEYDVGIKSIFGIHSVPPSPPSFSAETYAEEDIWKDLHLPDIIESTELQELRHSLEEKNPVKTRLNCSCTRCYILSYNCEMMSPCGACEEADVECHPRIPNKKGLVQSRRNNVRHLIDQLWEFMTRNLWIRCSCICGKCCCKDRSLELLRQTISEKSEV
jgi:hypothetical protein